MAFTSIFLSSCQPKTQEIVYLVELLPEVKESKLIEIFEAYELVDFRRSSKSQNQYAVTLKVEQGKEADLVSNIQKMTEVISISPIKTKVGPPTNSTNDKMSKTKPIKSGS